MDTHGSDGGRAGDADVDPITLSVLWDRLAAACEEMGQVLQRTAKSEAVASGQDFSTGLFDVEGRLLAQGDFSAGLLGALPYTIDHVRERFDVVPDCAPAADDELGPGDAVLLNDSRLGSGHLLDVFLFEPVFVDDVHRGWSVTTAHQVDVGGMVPGSQAVDASEIYQEGLRMLPTKVIVDGAFEPWFTRLLDANVRLPDMVLGDLRAQQNANHRGRELLADLFVEYGADTVTDCFDAILARSERRARAAISDLPDGTYERDDVMDPITPDGDPVHLEVAATVDGDELVLDYAGTDPQIPHGLNAFLNYTRAYAAFTLRAVSGIDLPHNEGFLRPLSVRTETGSFVDPTPEAAAGARAIVCQQLVDVNVGALSAAAPERLSAGSSPPGNPIYSGVDPETGERFVAFDVVVGGTGALHTKDGEEGLCASFNVTNIPVERHEGRYPLRVERLCLCPDTGGAGEYRGGSGVRKDVTALADLEVTVLMNRSESHPPGLSGGDPGATGRTRIVRAADPDGESDVHPKGQYDLAAGDTFVAETPGAGGYGDPLDRDPAAVAADVERGYVTREAARETYGVALGDGGAVDEAATRDLRADR